VLHALATQHLVELEPGQARMTCFCDFRGRLLHRCAVAVDRERAVWLLRDDAPGEPLAVFLDGHVFREDFVIEDRSSDWRARVEFDSMSSRVPATLEDVTTAWTGALDTEWAVPIAGGARIVVAASAGGRASDDAGRIAAGWPRQGHEIAEPFTPFEVGCAHEVHLHKGCYTGQEALMRLITYRSVRRRLVHLGGAGSPRPIPANVLQGNVTVGRLTSAAAIRGGWCGLAVVQHGVLAAAEITVEGAAIDSVDLLPATRPLGMPVMGNLSRESHRDEHE
jgi:folate-binding protein YgfZ